MMPKDEDSDMTCMHCGGKVDAEGYAMGGEITDEDGDELMRPMEVGDESSQHKDTERMRSLALALKGRR